MYRLKKMQSGVFKCLKKYLKNRKAIGAEVLRLKVTVK